MEQGPLLSNTVQQQSRTLEASLIAVNIAAAFLLIINLLNFEIISLVVETAVQIIAAVWCLSRIDDKTGSEYCATIESLNVAPYSGTSMQ